MPIGLLTFSTPPGAGCAARRTRRMRGETDTPACLAGRVCRLARSPMLPFHDPSIRFVCYLYRSRHFSLCLASGWDGCERCGEGVSSIARGSTSSLSVCATIIKMGVSASWKAVCCLVSVIAITSASSDSQGIDENAPSFR